MNLCSAFYAEPYNIVRGLNLRTMKNHPSDEDKRACRKRWAGDTRDIRDYIERNSNDTDRFRDFAGKNRGILPAVEDKPISSVRVGGAR